MDDPFAMVGLGLAALVIAAYVAIAARRQLNPHLVVFRILALMFAVVGVTAGVKLGYLAVVTSAQDLKPFASDDRYFIVAGGVSLIAVSVVGVIETIKA